MILSGGSGFSKTAANAVYVGAKAAFASLTPSSNGLIDFPTNGISIYRDSGTILEPWGPLFPLTTPPDEVNWSWLNQTSGATVSRTNGGIYLTCTSGNASVNQIIGRMVTAVATPYHYEAVMLPNFNPVNDTSAGIFLHETSSGKILALMVFTQTSGGTIGYLSLIIARWASFSSVGAATNLNFNNYIAPAYFLRIGDNGTNLTFDISTDGINWLQAYTEARNAYFTTGPNRAGVFLDNYNALVSANFISWKQTT